MEIAELIKLVTIIAECNLCSNADVLVPRATINATLRNKALEPK